MVGEIRARQYPTLTRKGMVFVWMGQGEPAPVSESIPEEFFEPESLVFNWVTEWPCNWRPALENIADSHFRYLHRNSVIQLMRPIPPPGIGMRGRPRRVNKHRLVPAGQEGTVAGTRKNKQDRPYQDYYPGVDAKWPKHRWRLLWTWIFDWGERRRAQRRMEFSSEWGPGQHLPSLFRLNYGSHMYTRWVVPIDEGRTRIFYFHTTRPGGRLGQTYEFLHWNLFHNWAMNQNFSEQDARGAIEAYHDTPEYLAQSDTQTVEWRRFLLTARGLELATGAGSNGSNGPGPAPGAAPEAEAAAAERTLTMHTGA